MSSWDAIKRDLASTDPYVNTVAYTNMQVNGCELYERVKELEDSLVRIGKLCLHTPASPIWDEVRSTVGEDGEKRLT